MMRLQGPGVINRTLVRCRRLLAMMRKRAQVRKIGTAKREAEGILISVPSNFGPQNLISVLLNPIEGVHVGINRFPITSL